MYRQTLNTSSFQTEFIPINIQILQSVLYNAQKQIPKVKLYLQFDDQVKYNNFTNKLTPALDQDEDMLLNSDSQLSNDEDQSATKVKSNQIPNTSKEILYEEKLSRLQLSIILKEHYKQRILKIMKQTGARILIVPEKIKFFGSSQQTIEQAKSLVHEIKIKIIVSCLQKFGKEAYESKFMRQKLEKCGILLGRVAEKYYYWYEFDENKQKIIKEVLYEQFNKSAHVFYPLIENYEVLRRKLNTKYIDALIKTRAQLYEKYLNNQINEDKQQLNAELNQEKTQIIIHIPVKQQSETLIYEIKRFFSQFVHFFIHYKVDENEQIEHISQIEKKLEQKGLKWFRHEELLVLNYQKKNYGRSHQNFNIASLQSKDREKEFLDTLKQVFELNLNFYIEYLGEEQKKLDDSEEKSIPLFKKITKQFKVYDGLCVISPKTQLVHLYLQIVDYFILKPILSQDKQKKKQQISVLNHNVEMNQTSMINDTTTLIEQSQFQQNSKLNQSHIAENSSNINKLNPILEGLKENMQLQSYAFYLQDVLLAKKYQDVTTVSRSKPFPEESREVLEEKLENVTNRKYQMYKVSVPEKLKVIMPAGNEIVTVFVRDADKQSLLKQKVNVYLLNKSKAIQVNGWLLNVSKTSIRDNNFKYEVEGNRFQIIAYLKYIG